MSGLIAMSIITTPSPGQGEGWGGGRGVAEEARAGAERELRPPTWPPPCPGGGRHLLHVLDGRTELADMESPALGDRRLPQAYGSVR